MDKLQHTLAQSILNMNTGAGNYTSQMVSSMENFEALESFVNQKIMLPTSSKVLMSSSFQCWTGSMTKRGKQVWQSKGCLDLFTRPEKLGSDQKLYCENCQEKQDALKQMSMKKLPLVLCVHIKWFHKPVTRCYCRSKEVAREALKAGLQPSQIKVFGLPMRPSFVKPVFPKVELRKELEIEGHLPVVLLMGGGEEMGPIEATARALADALYNERLGEPIGQVLVICGRNKKLGDRLNSVDWKIPVQVE